jgi:hypothetical protein
VDLQFGSEVSYQGTASRGCGKTLIWLRNRSSPQVDALIQSIDYRGRAAPSAPRESWLARNAGLQVPLFHGGARSIEVFPTEKFFVRESSVPQPLPAVPKQSHRETALAAVPVTEAPKRVILMKALRACLKAMPSCESSLNMHFVKLHDYPVKAFQARR